MDEKKKTNKKLLVSVEKHDFRTPAARDNNATVAKTNARSLARWAPDRSKFVPFFQTAQSTTILSFGLATTDVECSKGYTKLLRAPVQKVSRPVTMT